MPALDKHDLAALVHRAVSALDESETEAPQPEVDAAWDEEFRRRFDEVERGRQNSWHLEEAPETHELPGNSSL